MTILIPELRDSAAVEAEDAGAAPAAAAAAAAIDAGAMAKEVAATANADGECKLKLDGDRGIDGPPLPLLASTGHAAWTDCELDATTDEAADCVCSTLLAPAATNGFT